MAVEYFLADSDIQQKVWALIGSHHPDLASLNKGELVVVFRDKAAKAGGQVVLGQARKSPPLVNTLANEEYKFILEIAQDQWVDLSNTQQEALLDHLLCSCRVEEDEKTSTWKFSIARPDIAAFRSNVERYGMWFPKVEEEDAPAPEEASVDTLFGE